jgi:hypothetical protein
MVTEGRLNAGVFIQFPKRLLHGAESRDFLVSIGRQLRLLYLPL